MSACLWVIMVFVQSLFHTPQGVLLIFQGILSCPFFLVFPTFFQGSLLKKVFPYVSAWLFAVLLASLDKPITWVLGNRVPLPYDQICVLVFFVFAVGFCLSVRSWLRDAMDRLFSQLSARLCPLLLTYPCVSLVVFAIGTDNIFSPHFLVSRGIQGILFFMALCVVILILYVMTLRNIPEITCRRKMEEGLQFARQLIGKQREHYNQTPDYIKQVCIIKHGFRRHIHVLQNMEKEEQDRHLKNFKGELGRTVQMVLCQSQTVNRLLQEYVTRVRQEGITFEARADLPVYVSVDDLMLCIVIGNPLENTSKACRRIGGARPIWAQARWTDDYLMIMVGSFYNGQITQGGERILSGKKDGGLGIPNIRRILSHPEDEFNVDYNGTTSTATVKIVDRTMAR